MTDRLSGSLFALEAKSGIAGAYQLSSPDKTQSRCGRRKWKTLSSAEHSHFASAQGGHGPRQKRIQILFLLSDMEVMKCHEGPKVTGQLAWTAEHVWPKHTRSSVWKHSKYATS